VTTARARGHAVVGFANVALVAVITATAPAVLAQGAPDAERPPGQGLQGDGPAPDRAAAEPAAPHAGAPGEAAASPQASALELDAGFGILSRRLSWNDANLVGRGLPSYNMGAAPIVRARAAWYPGAHAAREGLPTVFGLAFQFDHSIAAGSESIGPSNVQYPTRIRHGAAAVRARGVFGSVRTWLDVGFGAQAFVLDAVEGEAPPNMPDVQYRYVTAEGGLAVELPTLRMGLTLGYRHMLHVGELGMETWFPRIRGAGVHGGLEIAYLLPQGFEVGLNGQVSWYMFDLRPEPGDPIWTERGAVAGGAVDRFASLVLHVGWRY
jgi:hypothetical protein